jgi:hypothetical protein
MIKQISDRMILQCFLKVFHLLKTDKIHRVRKLISNDGWNERTHLFVEWVGNKGRDGCIEQYEHDIIIPFTKDIISRIDIEMEYCDLLVFKRLPIPVFMDGCEESLDGVTARILTIPRVGYDLPVTRMDIMFVPLWLKQTSKDRLWYVGRD